MQQRDTDQLNRFMFERADVRGECVHLDQAWQEVLARRDYPPAVRRLLGELVAAAALLSANLKFTGSLVLQMQGRGPLRLLVVECTSELKVRAVAKWSGEIGEGAALAELLGDGHFVITIDQEGAKQPYQGIVQVEGGSVAEALEGYLARSEQIATRLWLASNDASAAGLLLQRLPDAKTSDADAWDRVTHLAATVTREELLSLPARQLLHRLFHEEDLRLYDPAPVAFGCSCSVERVRDMLRMLGEAEVRAILRDEGRIGVDCEYCSQHYAFDAVDAGHLLATDFVGETGDTRH